ncbi:MAG: hypothetical protein FWD58_09310 [Firmicutes bacterium]|nr:hypothetical protein [Bacillota bacterium]
MKYDFREIAVAMLDPELNGGQLYLLNINDCTIQAFWNDEREKADELLREYDFYIQIPKIDVKKTALIFMNDYPGSFEKALLKGEGYMSRDFWHDFFVNVGFCGRHEQYIEYINALAKEVAKNWVNCDFETDYMDDELRNKLLIN